MGKKREKIKWENILSPKEMKKKFGSQYYVVKMGEEIYINSNYLVERVLEDKPKYPEDIIKYIPRAYRSILKEIRKVENKKHYGNLYNEILRRKIQFIPKENLEKD